jgi:hypothetical protein
MVVFPVIVAFQTGDWLPIAVESYLTQFPADRIKARSGPTPILGL